MTAKRILGIFLAAALFLAAGAFGFAEGQTETAYGYGRGAEGRGAGINGNGSGQGRNRNVNDYPADETLEELVADIEAAPLNSEEKDGILYMREEEKLARDVYTALYGQYGLPVFRNIASSEQTHMDAMELLIRRYDLNDPVGADTAGVFLNPVLQELYHELVAQGSESLLAAVQIGAAIEELDIADLEKELTETDNDDIAVVYQNLLKGSRNHLRSFYFQIEKNGGDYQPVYLSEDHAGKIIETDRETGTVITDPGYLYF